MSKKIKSIANHFNSTYENMIYNLLKEYTLNVFEWVNLPNTVDELYLEKTLFEKGTVIYFTDRTLKIPLVLEGNIHGPLDFYGYPTRWQIYSSYNGYRTTRISTRCVPIYNNKLKQATNLIAKEYARRITEAQRTADVNINAQKTPIVVIATSEDQLLTIQNILKQYDGNEIAITVDENALDIKKISTLDLKVDFKADKIIAYKRELLNEFFTLIGINNANTDKKERMITGEVESNNDQIEHARFNLLAERKLACQKINEMFPRYDTKGNQILVDVRYKKTDTQKWTDIFNVIEASNIEAESNKFNAEAEEVEIQKITPEETNTEDLTKNENDKDLTIENIDTEENEVDDNE